jgi:hypothetical protein
MGLELPTWIIPRGFGLQSPDEEEMSTIDREISRLNCRCSALKLETPLSAVRASAQGSIGC